MAADQAKQMIAAKSVEPGKYDLVLEPSHMWLTIHESVGHPYGARPRAGLRSQLRRHKLPPHWTSGNRKTSSFGSKIVNFKAG